MTAWRAFDVDVDLPDWWTVWLGAEGAEPPESLGMPAAMRHPRRSRRALYLPLAYATIYEEVAEYVDAATAMRRVRRVVDAVGPGALPALGAVTGAATALLRALGDESL